MITVEVYNAKTNPRICKEFIQGHTRVLEIFKIVNITSNNVDWAFQENSLVIMIRNNGQLICGARIQQADGFNALPMEDAVKEIDESVQEIIQNEMKAGTAEFCGLWNTREGAKAGINSMFLGRMGVAVASQLNIKSLYALCAPSTVRTGFRTGFVIDERMGNKGTFYYPKLDLIATAMQLPDVHTLEFAAEEEKKKIFDLRERKNVLIEENIRDLKVEVHYNIETKF